MRAGHLRELTLLAALSLSPAPAAWGQAGQPAFASPTVERIETRTYRFEEAGADMEYQLYVPTAYDASTPAPLIVALHGLGSTPSRIMRYQGLTDLAEERGYIVAAPMGFNTRGWYGSRGHGAVPSRAPEAANDPATLGLLSEMDVMNVLLRVRRDFNVDPDRIYLMGHSMGGGGTWHLGAKYPDLWAALAPVAPAIYTSPDELEEIRHIPVIVLMGDADELVDVEVTRRWVARMRELGMQHSYVEIPGGDHSLLIARDPGNMRKIFDFFDQARRRD